MTVYCRPRYSLPTRPDTYQGVKLRYLPALYTKSLETLTHETLSAVHALFAGFDVLYVLGFRASAPLPAGAAGGKAHRHEHRRLRLAPAQVGIAGAALPPPRRDGSARAGPPRASSATRGRSSPTSCTAHRRDSTYIGYGANLFEPRNPSCPPAVRPAARRVPARGRAHRAREQHRRSSCARSPACETDKELIVVGAANYRSRYFEELKRTAGPACPLPRRHLRARPHRGDIRQFLCLHPWPRGRRHESGAAARHGLRLLRRRARRAVQSRGRRRRGDATGGRSDDDLAPRPQRPAGRPDRARMRFASAAKERVRTHYSWEDVADDYDRFFRQLGGLR